MTVNEFGKQRGNYHRPPSAPWSEHVLLESVVYTIRLEHRLDKSFLASISDRSIDRFSRFRCAHPLSFKRCNGFFPLTFSPWKLESEHREDSSHAAVCEVLDRRVSVSHHVETRFDARQPQFSCQLLSSIDRTLSVNQFRTRCSFFFSFFFSFSLGLTSRWNRGGRDLLIFLCNETKEGSIYWIFFFASRN